MLISTRTFFPFNFLSFLFSLLESSKEYVELRGIISYQSEDVKCSVWILLIVKLSPYFYCLESNILYVSFSSVFIFYDNDEVEVLVNSGYEITGLTNTVEQYMYMTLPKF